MAIILSRQDYKEFDSLVNVYTPHEGRLSLLARGTKKPGSKLAGHIEPLTLADIMVIKGRGFDYLGSAVTRKSYPLIRKELNRLYYAGRVLALYLRQTKENLGDEMLFALLLEYLEVIDNIEVKETLTPEKGELAFSALVLKFLDRSGHRPDLFSCLRCREAAKPGNNTFDLLNGGIICPKCLQKHRHGTESGLNDLVFISDDCIKISRYLLKSSLITCLRLKSDQQTVADLSKLWRDFLTFVKI